MDMNRGIYSKKSDMNEYDAIRRGFKTFPHNEAPGLIAFAPCMPMRYAGDFLATGTVYPAKMCEKVLTNASRFAMIREELAEANAYF